jgi:DNA-3-methyladenine glycosylase I
MPVFRCAWPRTDLDIAYHDAEWGVPEHDDQRLFELLTLEGAQAGLSWSTILKKRDGYRRAFAGFDPASVAAFTAADVDRLMADASIVRHRQKIESTITNARAVLAVQRDEGSFDRFLWRFVGGRALVNGWRDGHAPPTRSAESDALSQALLRRGFKFVGTTICYAYMQAAGLVNDHAFDCFRRAELASAAGP